MNIWLANQEYLLRLYGNMNYNDVDELREIIKNLNSELELLEKSKKAVYNMVLKEKQVPYCPICGSTNINKNGKYKDRQNYICKDCNKKFNGLTNTIFHHTHLTYMQIEKAIDCIINLFSIRKMAKVLKISTKTAFTLRHKIMSCLKSIVKSFKLNGVIELDEYYLSINLKGTKKKNMPRMSKKRTSHGSNTRGISSHKICVTSGIDENDNMFFEVAGTSSVTSKMIKDTAVPRISNSKKVITDCKSSYESVAKKNNWNLKQIKSGTYTDEENNNLANINSLHQQLTLYLSNFRGVSTKHLQEYLDLFCFLKYLDWKIEYSEQLKEFKDKICTKNTNITYNNVCDNYSIFDFNIIYADYNFHPLKTTT